MKLPALGQAKWTVGKRERDVNLQQAGKRPIGSSKKLGKSIRPGMDPNPAGPASGRLLERTTPLNGKTIARSSGKNGSDMAVTSIFAYGIEQTIPGCRQPQGWQQRTEHDSDPTHHPFDARKCKVFNVEPRKLESELLSALGLTEAFSGQRRICRSRQVGRTRNSITLEANAQHPRTDNRQAMRPPFNKPVTFGPYLGSPTAVQACQAAPQRRPDGAAALITWCCYRIKR